jgi:LAGLIDADG endonuclease
MQLDAQWIVGFVDGEGCFHVGVNPHPEMTAGAQVLPEFTVVQHERDVQVLHALKAYFGCGVVRKNNGDRMAYRVRGHEHLSKNIVPFFEKHLLKTRKRVDFIKFREIVTLMSRGEHLSSGGVDKIRAITEQMNRKGLKIKSDCFGNGVE